MRSDNVLMNVPRDTVETNVCELEIIKKNAAWMKQKEEANAVQKNPLDCKGLNILSKICIRPVVRFNVLRE